MTDDPSPTASAGATRRPWPRSSKSGGRPCWRSSSAGSARPCAASSSRRTCSRSWRSRRCASCRKPTSRPATRSAGCATWPSSASSTTTGTSRPASGRAAGRCPGTSGIGDGSQDLVALLAASMTSPSRRSSATSGSARLMDVVATLPDEHREALRLRYGEGLPTKEVAGTAGQVGRGDAGAAVPARSAAPGAPGRVIPPSVAMRGRRGLAGRLPGCASATAAAAGPRPTTRAPAVVRPASGGSRPGPRVGNAGNPTRANDAPRLWAVSATTPLLSSRCPESHRITFFSSPRPAAVPSPCRPWGGRWRRFASLRFGLRRHRPPPRPTRPTSGNPSRPARIGTQFQ